MNRIIIISLLAFAVTACVSGAPRLTPEQAQKLSSVSVYKKGEFTDQEYTEIKIIKAADCSGAPAGGRIWGNAEKAIDTLKRKAVSIGADAVIEVSCTTAPMVNNCWAAKACSGTAVTLP